MKTIQDLYRARAEVANFMEQRDGQARVFDCLRLTKPVHPTSKSTQSYNLCPWIPASSGILETIDENQERVVVVIGERKKINNGTIKKTKTEIFGRTNTTSGARCSCQFS